MAIEIVDFPIKNFIFNLPNSQLGCGKTTKGELEAETE
jgi:hypothetical protein